MNVATAVGFPACIALILKIYKLPLKEKGLIMIRIDLDFKASQYRCSVLELLEAIIQHQDIIRRLAKVSEIRICTEKVVYILTV